MACTVHVNSPDLNKELTLFVKGDLYVFSGGVVICNEDHLIEEDTYNVDFTVIYPNPSSEDFEIGDLVCEDYKQFRRFKGSLTLSQEG